MAAGRTILHIYVQHSLPRSQRTDPLLRSKLAGNLAGVIPAASPPGCCCLPAGGRAWQTPFSAHVPVLDGVPVEEAAVHSIVLQMPLEGKRAIADKGRRQAGSCFAVDAAAAAAAVATCILLLHVGFGISRRRVGRCRRVLSNSVILKPHAGPLEKKGGGLPFVLKRTDGGKPEWVKREDHHDFVLPLDQVGVSPLFLSFCLLICL